MSKKIYEGIDKKLAVQYKISRISYPTEKSSLVKFTRYFESCRYKRFLNNELYNFPNF